MERQKRDLSRGRRPNDGVADVAAARAPDDTGAARSHREPGCRCWLKSGASSYQHYRTLADFATSAAREALIGISRPHVQNAPPRAHFSDLRDWLAEESQFELSVDFVRAMLPRRTLNRLSPDKSSNLRDFRDESRQLERN
jgi:hypothetical protein